MAEPLKRGYNLDFKMYMEGVEIPFSMAMVKCTPGGTEANISIYSSPLIYEIKPKTAVQIFYRDWIGDAQNPEYRLMFDGFFSGYYKQDQSTQGRMVSIVCRDIRVDLRKAPAAMCYMGINEFTTSHRYNASGLYQNFVVKGISPSSRTSIRAYDQSGIQDLAVQMRRIAGTAAGAGLVRKEDGEYSYSQSFGSVFKKVDGNTNSGFFLDALVRGIWVEAVGGTSIGSFINRRIRMDKRILVPVNKTGYNFWNSKNASIMAPSYLMGNSKFSSLEAAIMRVAGLFSVIPHSCSTPACIPLEDSDTAGMVIDQDVKSFLVDRNSAEFGGKFILNELMLLPPLDLTSPPNCNLVFPPMYDSITWQYDIDSDYSRGHFDVMNLFAGGGELGNFSVQIPTALFNRAKTDGSGIDSHGRRKPPITLFERYNGVNTYYGSVVSELGQTDAIRAMGQDILNSDEYKKLEQSIAEKRSVIEGLRQAESSSAPHIPTLAGAAGVQEDDLRAQIEEESSRLSGMRSRVSSSRDARTKCALQYHALIKYLGAKYQGRVATVDMQFNPYLVCGFPAAVVNYNLGGADSRKNSEKTFVGMLQQLKHTISISSEGADASTSCVISGVRFSDEPTDFDENGYPMYCDATNKEAAKIDRQTGKFINKDYKVQSGRIQSFRKLNPNFYDVYERKGQDKELENGKYIKDAISLSAVDAASARSNRIYLDDIYEPNKIHWFYKKVLGCEAQHFMLGNDGRNVFAYDTMHEAFETLTDRHPQLFSDYEYCIRFVRRNVCTIGQFFHAILGLSEMVSVEENGWIVEKYINYINGVTENGIAKDEYFGVTTEKWDSGAVDGLKVEKGGLMSSAGEMSSIMESDPVTPFIKERKDAVKEYARSFGNHGVIGYYDKR